MTDFVFFAVGGSCKEILYNCLLHQLTFRENMTNVLADVLFAGGQEFTELGLAEPYRVVFKANFHAGRKGLERSNTC